MGFLARYVVIGGVAAGAAFAAKMRRLDEKAEIVMFERGAHVSYANCGLPYYIGGVIEKEEELLLHTPESLKERFNIEVLVNTEVLSIDRTKKLVVAKNLSTGVSKEYHYDKLMLAPGGSAIRPNIEGRDLPEVFIIKDVVDTIRIKAFIDERKPTRVAVIGGGFIGLEMAENFHAVGLDVTIVEATRQVMPTYDYEMAAILHNHLRQKGVHLKLNNMLKGIKKNADGLLLELAEGSLTVDFVLMAIGVRPNTELAKAAGLEIGTTGGIKTNDYAQTSDKDIYAAGDAVESTGLIDGKPVLIPLAGIANKQSRVAAFHIAGQERKKRPVIGTSVVKVFDLTAAMTGKNEKQLKESNVAYDKVYLHPGNHAGYYPGSSLLSIKLLFGKVDGRVLGGQIIGQSGTDKRIDVLAVAISAGFTVDDLGSLELAYAPPYSSTRDPINYAGDIAAKIVEGNYKQFFCEDCIEGENTFLLDARLPEEYERGTIGKAINIPLQQMRQRMQEIPKGKDVYVFCQSGLRSYLCTRILQQEGFNVTNLSGGYLSWRNLDKDNNKV